MSRKPSHATRAVACAGLVVACALAACAARAPRTPLPPMEWTEAVFEQKPLGSWTIAQRRGEPPAQTVVGGVGRYEIRAGDTLLDVARYHDLGYNEIVAANPGVDPWIPKPGTEIVLPTQWVLPCCSYDGIVINIPEMRLYHYERAKTAPDAVTVRTHPVGLGRDDRRTPRGTFEVRGKTVNPTWNIPESIRREHIAERGDHRRAIPGGAPDNPLGRHRIELASSLYAIHGTDIPWGVGMLVSHGCVRLYPEDIESLFPAVKAGTPVRFVYQPVKVGTHDGATYVEVHEDVYGYARSLPQAARAALGRRKLEAGVDGDALDAALREPRGVPVRVSSESAAEASVEPRQRAAGADQRS